MALYVNGKQISGGGGGGNTNSVELTYAEYQALTPEQQLDGTEYFITDINGDGQQFQPICYSEEEREIGVWTDGKPLYEKTLSFNPVAIAPSYDLPHGISNIDTVVDYDVFITRSDSWTVKFAWATTNNSSTTVSVDSTNIKFAGTDNWPVNTYTKLYVTLRYTKTTDQAGSGTWTPQGIPAHHYSTDEQVVGTWIDGSTLYEITLHTTTAVNLNAQTWTQIPWDNEPSNIDRLISAELIGVVPNTYMVIRFGLDSGHIKAAASVGGSFPTGIGQTDGNEYVTIRYTKTTT